MDGAFGAGRAATARRLAAFGSAAFARVARGGAFTARGFGLSNLRHAQRPAGTALTCAPRTGGG
ncbi:MAG: hypothetical protein K2X34_06565, partial [Hyphomonadaceae bacterium]|nr:hypothetical protein [Hyphomonadaceae bacterium]